MIIWSLLREEGWELPGGSPDEQLTIERLVQALKDVVERRLMTAPDGGLHFLVGGVSEMSGKTLWHTGIPAEPGSYLVSGPGVGIDVCMTDGKSWNFTPFYNWSRITHWMPLPEPPSEVMEREMENQEFDPESAYGRGFAAAVLTHAAQQLRLVIRLLEQLPSADREIHHRLGAALFDLEELQRNG